MVDLSQVTPGYASHKPAVQAMKTGPTLLLTRPLAQSTTFLEQCTIRLGRPIKSVISPILRIEPIGDPLNWPATHTIVVTSSNAVRRLADSLNGRAVAAVGEATAKLAREYGADAKCLGETADAFLKRADQLSSPVLVARGVHTRIDLASALSTRGISAESVIVYDQIEELLSPEALALLAGSQPVAVPVFSPRSAALLGAYPNNAPLTVLAISTAVADAWPGHAEIKVALRPDADEMCDLVTEVL